MHQGTTVRFAVNGKISAKWAGCLLAPLLFTIAVETLALAVQQRRHITGVAWKKQNTSTRHKVSAFVDDSAVFVGGGRELPHIMLLLEKYGDLSGLRVQPDKSADLCLNSARYQSWMNGISML
ncbi:hypothetical protein PybrP1_001958 [[Pythium] brassicae (nom. inval.)]|nr:hypothetical protein PybrP1_001958 [[Pythium] brassicae (nom. inval.)]